MKERDRFDVWFANQGLASEHYIKCHKAWDSALKGKERNGEWQKPFVGKLIGRGISFADAMFAMALVCDENQQAYMQGYNKGYEDGIKDEKNKNLKGDYNETNRLS